MAGWLGAFVSPRVFMSSGVKRLVRDAESEIARCFREAVSDGRVLLVRWSVAEFSASEAELSVRLLRVSCGRHSKSCCSVNLPSLAVCLSVLSTFLMFSLSVLGSRMKREVSVSAGVLGS